MQPVPPCLARSHRDVRGGTPSVLAGSSSSMLVSPAVARTCWKDRLDYSEAGPERCTGPCSRKAPSPGRKPDSHAFSLFSEVGRSASRLTLANLLRVRAAWMCAVLPDARRTRHHKVSYREPLLYQRIRREPLERTFKSTVTVFFWGSVASSQS